MSYINFIARACSFALVIALTACNGSSKTGEESKAVEVIPEDIVEMRADQIKMANIQLDTIEQRTLSGRLKVSGIVSVAPQHFATVCAPMGGFIKSTTLIAGSTVAKGQTLAVIENQEFIDMQQSYLKAKNNYALAEEEYKRHSELYKEDVYSQKSMQQVTTEYKNLKAEVTALAQKLTIIGIDPAQLNENTIRSSFDLKSPIAGAVTKVNVNIGRFVSPTDVLFEVVNSDKLLLELTLFEKDADKVVVGQKIEFFINNETERHEAVVYQTAKSVDADKNYKVYASVTGTCKNVLPGMYVNAIIETSGTLSNALPSEAVVQFDDKNYIFAFEKNKEEGGKPFTEYRMIEVQVGLTDAGYTEVILPEGIDAQKIQVVTKGAYNLLSAKKNAGEMAC